MRAIEKRLKPLWDAEEAECERIEQAAFHETKSSATADPAPSTDEYLQSMKRAFRERTGGGRAARRKSLF